MNGINGNNPTVISQSVLDFTDRHKLVVCREMFGSKDVLDIRHWYKSKTIDKFLPTKKGIGLPVETWPEVIALIQKNLDGDKRINFE